MNLQIPRQVCLRVVLVLVGLGTCGCPGTPGSIYGTVEDAETQEPLAGATVSVLGTFKMTRTDSSGEYDILGLRPNTYSVQVSAPGDRRQLEVPASDN